MSIKPAEIWARYGVQYLTEIPLAVPAGRVVVHNHVTPQHPLGRNGFRAWLAVPGAKYVPCSCSWAPELGGHYRVDRAAS